MQRENLVSNQKRTRLIVSQTFLDYESRIFGKYYYKLVKKSPRRVQEGRGGGDNQESQLPVGLPLHLVKKEEGSFRPCSDYRLLNNQTKPDTYAVQNKKWILL